MTWSETLPGNILPLSASNMYMDCLCEIDPTGKFQRKLFSIFLYLTPNLSNVQNPISPGSGVYVLQTIYHSRACSLLPDIVLKASFAYYNAYETRLLEAEIGIKL